MYEKHLSSQFDSELNALRDRVSTMGNLVKSQLSLAVQFLNTFDVSIAQQVTEQEKKLNMMDVEIDFECSNIIVRRQPTARDLRLLMAISKTITNLERAGDEAEKIIKRTQHMMKGDARPVIDYTEIKQAGQMVMDLFERVLVAFAHLDTIAAAEIVRDDKAIDQVFHLFLKKLVNYMMQNPNMISVGFDFLFIAKAIERIGDHAKNLAEFIIYIVKGTDVRHLSHEYWHNVS